MSDPVEIHVDCEGCRDELERLRLALAASERARGLAVAHDRQPYPTAAAYEAVCAALATERAAHEEAEKEPHPGPDWACADCGETGVENFEEVKYDVPGEPVEYDMRCLNCESTSVFESPTEALHAVTTALDSERVRADGLAEALKRSPRLDGNGETLPCEGVLHLAVVALRSEGHKSLAAELELLRSSQRAALARPGAEEIMAMPTEADKELAAIDLYLDRRSTLDGLTRLQKIALALRVCEETDPRGDVARKYVVRPAAATDAAAQGEKP